MTAAYVDSSCLVALAFDESGAAALARRLRQFGRLLASNLLEAELRAALRREGVDTDPAPLLSWITWVYPDRPLTPEYQDVLRVGGLKGADLWHLACALFVGGGPELTFLTLDRRQKQVAARLRFRT